MSSRITVDAVLLDVKGELHERKTNLITRSEINRATQSKNISSLSLPFIMQYNPYNIYCRSSLVSRT